MKKKCPECGTEFEATKNKRFCCKACKKRWERRQWVEAHKKHYKRVCPICGNEFDTTRINQKYDKKECYQKAKSKRIYASYHSKSCIRCGVPLTGSAKKYCPKCLEEVRKERDRKRKKARKMTCPNCKLTFIANGDLFCCEACKAEYYRENKTVYIRTCANPNCGIKFATNNPRKIYHGKGCAQAVYGHNNLSSVHYKDLTEEQVKEAKKPSQTLDEAIKEAIASGKTYGQYQVERTKHESSN